jgi:hypothetical protein
LPQFFSILRQWIHSFSVFTAKGLFQGCFTGQHNQFLLTGSEDLWPRWHIDRILLSFLLRCYSCHGYNGRDGLATKRSLSMFAESLAVDTTGFTINQSWFISVLLSLQLF